LLGSSEVRGLPTPPKRDCQHAAAAISRIFIRQNVLAKTAIMLLILCDIQAMDFELLVLLFL